jgi:hypothetical protein
MVTVYYCVPDKEAGRHCSSIAGVKREMVRYVYCDYMPGFVKQSFNNFRLALTSQVCLNRHARFVL